MNRRTLNNWLQQRVVSGAALLLLLAGFSSFAQAVPSCLADVDGPNDPSGDGQGDITRLCTDNANLPTSFDIYMSWDETAFSGKNTGDACALFDTDGDPGGNIDYAICISVGGSPASLSAGPLIYSCGNSSPDRCASPATINPSGATTCSALVTNEDPFPAGDDSPGDTVGVCTIDPVDIPSGAVRTNLCSFPSVNPNSDPKDCVGVVGGGFITIEKLADPDDGTNFSFTLDGQSYTISGSGTQLVSLAAGQTYSVAETVPANWALSTASCVDNRTSLPVGTFDNADTVTGLALSGGDDFTCTFSNTKNFVDLVLAKSVNDATPDEGNTISYTLQLTNNGPVAATDIDVTDIVPPGVTYVSSSISGGDSNDDSSPGGSGLTWTVNNLASGSSTSLTFQATVDGGTNGSTISNTATKSQTEPDTNASADVPSVDITVNAFPGTDGVISITDPIVVGDVLTVSVTDADLDVTVGVDTVDVEVNGSNGENETLTLTETGASTGVFTNTLATVFGASAGPDDDGSLTTQSGDTVTASYTDSADAGGGSTVRSDVGSVVGGTDGVISITDPIVPGDVLTVSVTDADLDVTVGVDTVDVEVNGSNGENETLTLTETGASTGVFTNTLATVFGASAGPDDDGSLTTQSGDTVTASYTDSADAGGGSTVRSDVGSVVGGTDGVISITDPIVVGDVLTVSVTDADLDVTVGVDTVDVEVNGSNGENETLTLTETGASTGVFTNTLATVFGASAGPDDDGSLTTQSGDTVTASYTDSADAGGGSTVRSDVGSVVGGTDGVISITDPIVVGDVLTVSVTDADLDVTVGVDTVDVEVNGSNGENETLTLTETGASTGVFTNTLATVFGASAGPDDDGSLTTQSGDTVTASYTDSADAGGGSTVRSDVGSVVGGTDGVISITDPIVVGDVLTVSVTDADLDVTVGVDTVDVEVNGSNGENETLTLTETGASTGVFTNTLATVFGASAGPDDDGSLTTQSGDTVTASYTDSADAGGGSTVRSDVGSVVGGTDGVISITDPIVVGDVLTVSVTDADLDVTVGVDTVDVEVNGSNGENETLTLTETGASTGVFTNTLATVFGASAGPDDDGSLTTQSGDTVTASYTDSADAGGGSTVRSDVGSVVGGTDGVISITDPIVVGDVLTVSVTDADLDVTVGVDTVDVEVNGSNGENETLTLTETGASTGVFTNTLATVFGASAGPDDDGSLTTQSGDTVTASYTDSADAGGGSTVRSDVGSVVGGTDGVISITDPIVVGDVLTVSVTDADLDVTVGVDTVDVEVNGSNGENETLTLTETGASTGVFTNTLATVFGASAGPDDDGSLTTQSGDTVTASYTDSADAGGGSTVRSDVGSVVGGTDGVISITDPIVVGDVLTVSVTDADLDVTVGVDTVDVEVNGSNGENETLTLTETGASTGVFTNTLATVFGASAGPDDDGSLTTQSGDTVTASYTDSADAGGGSTVRSDVGSVVGGTDGVISITDPIVVGDVLTVSVTDADLDVTVGVDTVDVEVNGSNGENETLTLTETGASTGVFTNTLATVFGASAGPDDDGSLTTQSGDTVTASYTDSADAGGGSTVRSDVGSVVGGTDGVISITDPIVVGDVLTVSVTDADLDVTVGVDTVDVEVNGSNGENETLTLTETGASTGVFTNTLATVFGASAGPDDDGSLTTQSGDTVTASYTDSADAGGGSTVRSDVGSVVGGTDGVISITDPIVVGDVLTVSVTDADLDVTVGVDTVDVEVNGSNGENETLTLTETGASTGVFTNTLATVFGASAGPDDDGSLTTQSGDTVTASYTDSADAGGGSTVRSDVGSVVGGTDGVISITDPIVVGDVLTVSVTDADLDVTVGVDTVDVEVNGSNGENETLTLTETGASTGVFTNTLATVFGASAGPDDDGSLTTQSGDTVTASYTDSADAGGGSTVRSDVGSVVGGTDGVISITDPIVVGDVLTVSVTDADLDVTVGVDTVDVEVNGSNGENETLTLTETGASTGVFTNTLATVFGASAGPDDDGSLTTQSGDTVTASYTDSADAGGGSTVRSDVGAVDNPVSSINGMVWLDENHDGAMQISEPLLPNWTVQLLQGGLLVDTATTDNNGFYEFTDLVPGAGYSIDFENPDNNVVWGQIAGLTLDPGVTSIDQSLPVDPQGVVYDSVSRNPLSGAVLTLVDDSGSALPVACFINANQQGQASTLSGQYRFDLVAGADPACPLTQTVYRIAVSEPGGYQSPPSATIAPQVTPLDPTGLGNPYLVVPANTAPAGADPTTYYLSFVLASGDPDVLNNHIPLDPVTVTGGDIVLSKTAAKREVSVGDMLFYTLTAENVAAGAVNGITLSDLIPGGFKYVKDSARLIRAGSDGELGTDDDLEVRIKPAGNRPIEFTNLDFSVGETLQVRYLLRVGAGVGPGEYINRATPLFNGSAAGNTASAKVSVVADPIFDKTTVIGKVFHDRDGDGWQDAALASGLTVTADLDASVYIRGSTRIERDGISTAVADSKSAPIAAGVKLGELSGRHSIADLPERHRVTLRIGMYNAVTPAIQVTTAEGAQLSIDAAGRQTLEPVGDVAGGRSGQDIVVERRVVAAEHGYDLVVSITNYGIEEAGIPGVRLATVGGLLIETDARGRYHIADVDPGKLSRGRNYILKVDSATLPPGSEFTTENPRVIRITGGLMNKLNFGVRLPDQALPEKVARIRLGEVFFEVDSELIKPANQPMLTKIANAIRHYRCGVISITGHTDDPGRADYNLKLGQRRADSVRRALGKLLDKSLMEQVDILVTPPADQHSSLETLSTGLGRLLAGLVDVLVPVAHAEEHDNCVSTACAEDSGVVIDVVSRGELEPRSSNTTAEGRADNRRVDVIFNGRLQLRDGGTLWATEDPAIIEPRLSVSGPAFVSYSEGRFTQPAVFRLYSNYSHFIERWELGVYDASDTDLIVPLKTFSGNRIAYETGVEWNGETDRGRPLRAGDELVYLLRVFDADGRFDETAVASLYVGDPVVSSPAASTRLNETLNGYGESSLVRQTILLSGSRVRIHGSDVPAAYALSIDGEPVPLDSRGTFAIERILPAGEYHMDVAITDARNESWHRQLDVKVSGGYLFMVGIADLTVGENDFSGSKKALSDEADQDGSVSDGRLAFYMKGKFAGKYRVTAQLDTTEEDLGDVFSDLDRKDPDSVFRRLDPDRYYPTFGDESTTTSDVDTQGRFYGRVEWDKSQALWGNFNTGITGNEYIQYDRSLYGGRMQYRDVDITRFGDHKTELMVFASEPNTAFAHNEFSGTGGSLYYLRNTDIVQGSEKVWVEVRERDTNRVLENITLQSGSDYQVDDIQGRIILNRPLAQVSSSAAPSIIKDRPLDGNDMYLMVDYEYVPDEFDNDKMTYGIRGKDWLTDRLGLGGTYVREDRDGTNYELKGADITLRHSTGTYIKAEYARSDARQTAADFSSDNGGLSFSALNDSTDENVSGDAIKLEARVNHAEVTQGRAEGLSAVWWKHRDKGFSVARVDDGIDTTEYGAESSWQATENLGLAVRGAVIDKEDDMEDRSLSAQADYRTNGPWTFSGELRYVSEDPDGESSRDATLAGAGVGYALAPGTSVYSTVQTAVSRDSDYDANNLYTLGMKARVGKRVTLNAQGSTGNRGEALQLGADYKVGSDYSMYTSYTLSTDRSEGRKGVAVFGQRRQVGNSLRVFTEKQFSSGDEQSGLSTVYGLDYTPATEWTLSALFQNSNPDDDDDGLERNAVSLGARYQGERLDFSNRLEYRRDRGDEDETQWLTANNLRFLINEEWTGVGKLNFSYSDNHDTGKDDGRFAEFDAGLAYRPVYHDRLNILSKYTYLYDLDSAGQQDAGTDERSHVVSLEGIYDLNQRWELGSKLAWKRGEEREGRDEGRWFRTVKRLAVVRGRYHLTRHWDGLLEYRWLDVDEADDNRQGALLGIDRHINDHLKIGVGYNFTDFSDDLTDLDYQNNGWFLNFVGKL